MIRDLGDGLILRRATAADADEVAVFNARVMRDDDEPENRPVERMELRPGASWLPAMPSILRALAALGPGYARPEAPFTSLRLALGADHPAYAALRDVPPAPRRLYAWYVRVADLPGFLRHVAPALEARLAASPAAGHTGQLRLTFYRSGLTLRLEGGRLGPVEPTDGGGKSDAAFPDLTFVQLVFGAE